jgi:hypothetical protein
MINTSYVVRYKEPNEDIKYYLFNTSRGSKYYIHYNDIIEMLISPYNIFELYQINPPENIDDKPICNFSIYKKFEIEENNLTITHGVI